MKKLFLQSLYLLIVVFLISKEASSYIIYSISQDFPMGTKEEKIFKNFYVNMGTKQGVKEGGKLEVFRTISRLDPFDNNKRYEHVLKIGELNVIHADEESSITKKESFNLRDALYVEIPDFMIGDEVKVEVK